MPWTVFETAIGPCGLAWNEIGVVAFQLPEETRAATEKRLVGKSKEPSEASSRTTPKWAKDTIARVQKHFTGTPQDFTDVPLDLARVSEFDRAIYLALAKVPSGTTVTYGDLAKALGKPGAARAVGRAMGANPIPLIVPCHRVLAAGGKPGGFSAYGGVVTKDRILELEGATLKKPEPKKPKAVSTKQESLFATTTPTSLAFDVDEALAHLENADPVLAKHIARVPFGLRLKETDGTFAALAEAIVYQQLHGKAAATIFGRLAALFPKGRLEPKRLLAMSDESLRGAGLSQNKLASLKDLASHATEGRIPTLQALGQMDDEAIVAALTKVRGIGRWTVEMLLMFRLGRPDVLPVADYGIKKGFARLFATAKTSYTRDELPPVDEVLRRGERWRPYRSVASWYLWRASEIP